MKASVDWGSPCLGLAPLDRGLAMLDALLSRAVSSSPLPELHLFVRLWRRGDDPPEHLLELFHGHGWGPAGGLLSFRAFISRIILSHVPSVHSCRGEHATSITRD